MVAACVCRWLLIRAVYAQPCAAAASPTRQPPSLLTPVAHTHSPVATQTADVAWQDIKSQAPVLSGSTHGHSRCVQRSQLLMKPSQASCRFKSCDSVLCVLRLCASSRRRRTQPPPLSGCQHVPRGEGCWAACWPHLLTRLCGLGCIMCCWFVYLLQPC